VQTGGREASYVGNELEYGLVGGWKRKERLGKKDEKNRPGRTGHKVRAYQGEGKKKGAGLGQA